MHNEIQISMRTWRSPMSAASQGAFVVIPEISHSDIFYIIKKERDARARNFMQAKNMNFRTVIPAMALHGHTYCC